MKTLAAFALLCLLLVNIRGQARDPRRRCLCADIGLKMLHRHRVEKVEILPPSTSCEKQEIIATLKDGAGKKCLNPESVFVQELIKRMLEKKNQK